MRIERIGIDGFGHFAGAEVGPLDGRLSVIAGANEAGKSTLLAFIRTVLFGFPAQRSDRHYPPLAGGRHGGRLRVTTSDGRGFVVQRHRGPRGGEPEITTAEGQRCDGSMLGLITGHAPADLFQSVFAFSLAELQGLSNEASERIYSAGTGAARLPKALQDLEKAQKEIFVPKGSKHEVAKVLNELHGVESKLGGVAAQASEYGQLTERHSAISRSMAEIEARRGELSARAHELDRLLRAWAEWEPMRAIEGQLQALPRYEEFPEDAMGRLDALERQIGQLELDRNQAREELEERRQAAEAEVPDEALVEEKETIEAIRRGRRSLDASLRDLPEREAELRSLEQEIGESLRSLGPEWDEDRLDRFDTSVARRDQVEQWRTRLADADRAVREASAGVTRQEQALRDAEEARKEADSALERAEEPALKAEDLEAQRRRMRSARSRLAEYSTQRQRKEDLQGQLGDTESRQGAGASAGSTRLPVLPVLLVVAGIAGLVAGLVMDGQQVALLLGVALLLAGAVAFVQARPARHADGGLVAAQVAGLRRQVEGAEEAEQEAASALRDAAGPLGLDLPDNDALDEAEERLAAAQRSLEAWTSLVRDRDEAAREVGRPGRRLEEAREAFARAEGEQRARREEWRAWLAEALLPETLTPDTAIGLFDRIETVRAKRREVENMRRRVGAIKEDIEVYRRSVEAVALRHGAAGASLDVDRLAGTADALIERLDVAREKDRQRESDRQALEGEGRELEKIEKRLEGLEREKRELIEKGGAEDGEELRRRAAQHAERQELERGHREHRARLPGLCSPNESPEELVEVLRNTTAEALREESESVNAELAGLDERRSGLREERGRVASRIEALAGEEESSELRARREVLVEQLRTRAGEWSRLTLAQSLLQRTREKYEQERRPDVMRHAEEFFGAITCGAYRRLVVPLNQRTVEVVDGSGATKGPGELSRGTREQLYLSLRFGLIREFGQHAENLPVVVDEALVNFDPMRAQRAAEAFARLSETNQVLVFTCHPETVEQFRRAAPGASVVTLGGAGGGS